MNKYMVDCFGDEIMGGKSSNFILEKIGIFGYISVLLFNGIIKHIGLSIHFLEQIRLYLPEMFMFLIILGWIISKKYIKKIDLFFMFWIIIVMILSTSNIPSANSVLSAIRDLLEPFVLLFVISTRRISTVQRNDIDLMIERLFAFFILIGIAYAVIQRINGSVWTSIYFTGHQVWGVDTISGIRVTSGSFGFKVLGTTASAETFGFYNMLAIILVLFSNHFKKVTKTVLVGIAFVSIFFSGMKTALIVAILIVYICLMNKFGKQIKLFTKLGSVVLLLALFYYMTFVLSDWEDSSILQRLILWQSLGDGGYGINMIIPMSMFFFSAKAGNTGVISFWDNSYLYLMFSTGIIGLYLSVNLIYQKVKLISHIKRSWLNADGVILLSLALCSASTCLFFGRNYIAVALIIIGYHYAEKNVLFTEK